MSENFSRFCVFPYKDRSNNSEKRVIKKMNNSLSIFLIFSLLSFSTVFCQDLSIVNDPRFNCPIDFYYCIEEGKGWSFFAEESVLLLRKISTTRYRFFDFRGTIGESMIYPTDKFSFVHRVMIDSSECVDNIISFVKLNRIYQTNPNRIRAIFHQTVSNYSLIEKMIKHNFHPLFLSEAAKTKKITEWETFFGNLCYYKSRERKCTSVPKIANANQNSLNRCRDTPLFQNCSIECNEGYYSKHDQVMCMFLNRWNYNKFFRTSDIVQCEVKNDVCLYSPYAADRTLTNWCINKKVGSVCIPHCPYGYHTIGIGFLCRYNDQYNFAFWDGSSKCIQLERYVLPPNISENQNSVNISKRAQIADESSSNRPVKIQTENSYHDEDAEEVGNYQPGKIVRFRRFESFINISSKTTENETESARTEGSFHDDVEELENHQPEKVEEIEKTGLLIDVSSEISENPDEKQIADIFHDEDVEELINQQPEKVERVSKVGSLIDVSSEITENSDGKQTEDSFHDEDLENKKSETVDGVDEVARFDVSAAITENPDEKQIEDSIHDEVAEDFENKKSKAKTEESRAEVFDVSTDNYEANSKLEKMILRNDYASQDSSSDQQLKLFRADLIAEESMCVAKKCGLEGVPSEVLMITHCSGFHFGDECVVVCRKQYLRFGEKAMCGDDGRWVIQSKCEHKLKIAAAAGSVLLAFGLVMLSMWVVFRVWKQVK